ncbi:metal-dependent hydrolase [Vibrio sp. 10N]|uniref:metal-dependent hydrolase n=1 Tax=Vibrio sp. 10N TaxID=3058938 RepID=UPI002812CFC5|nr:metal-dependent hydrolase [Vibrio sp. 10N]
MDPLSQGLLGASLSMSASKRARFAVAGVLGLLSGLAPDLDVLIRSPSDPLLFLEFHRQFTHSLLFIPIGSLICACLFYPLIAKRHGFSFKQTWFYCFLGYATHGLLDACTSYGTQLLWPLSNERFAWNSVSVIDPLFTIPLLAILTLAAWKRHPAIARIGFLWAITYLTIGMIQRERAEHTGWQIAKERQHRPVQLEAKPSFGNILVWKVIYEDGGDFYIDAVRAGQDIKVYLGTKVAKLDIESSFPWLDASSQQARDIQRFNWFSDGFVALSSNDELRIIDVRYSIVPNELNALWSIELAPAATADQHVTYHTHRSSQAEDRQRFYDMLLGREGFLGSLNEK